jgi:exonuclease VII large subunit
LAAGVLNFIKVKEKIDIVVAERNDWNQRFVATDAELNSTQNKLANTEKELDKTKENLAQSERERATAVAEADTQSKRAADLTENLNRTFRERDDARANLAAYEATGFTPPQIANLGRQIRDAQEALAAVEAEKAVLQSVYTKTKDRLDWITGAVKYVELPNTLRGKILVTDPKWEFVVVNIGEDEGAKVNGELLVSRNGQLVGKVIITDVQKNRSIANVVPGWRIGDVVEGDQVIPAHPES